MTSHIKELFLVGLQVAHSPILLQLLISEIEGRGRPSLLRGFHSALNKIQLSDLGLTPATQASYFIPGFISYTGIYEVHELCVCFFSLAAGTKMPLHDHPEMAVLTRVVMGRLRLRLADLQEEDGQGHYKFHEVRAGEVAAPDTFMLTPSSGNLHEFEALEDTVLLDVIMPNYSALRDVTYYEQVSEEHLHAMTPADLHFREVKYEGESTGAGLGIF